ncbi:hypothetical protein PIB30_091330, partial [Stylosanthes scabra]|nr:hypothetical protein [Stylosanthes scabra]
MRFGSGTPPGRGLAPWLGVPCAGSKFGVLLSQFPNFRLHRLHAMSQLLGNLGFIQARSTERSLGWSARFNPIEGTLPIALGWVPRGWLPVLDSPRICIHIATSSGFISYCVEVQRLLLLLVSTLIVAGMVGVDHAFCVL